MSLRCGKRLLYDNRLHARGYTNIVSIGTVVPLLGVVIPHRMIGARLMIDVVWIYCGWRHWYKMGLLVLIPVRELIIAAVVGSNSVAVAKELVVERHGEYQAA